MHGCADPVALRLERVGRVGISALGVDCRTGAVDVYLARSSRECADESPAAHGQQGVTQPVLRFRRQLGAEGAE